MRRQAITFLLVATVSCSLTLSAVGDGTTVVKEVAIDGPASAAIKVRMEGPYTADVQLQVVCYFKYTESGAARMSGAPVELDKRLGGVISSLRARGEFTGEKLETLVLHPKAGSIKAKAMTMRSSTRLCLNKGRAHGLMAGFNPKSISRPTRIAFTLGFHLELSARGKSHG